MNVTVVRIEFDSLDYARGFAQGVEHVNDSAIDNVRAFTENGRFFVTYDDSDEER